MIQTTKFALETARIHDLLSRRCRLRVSLPRFLSRLLKKTGSI